MAPLSHADVEAAARCIRGRVHRTPVMVSRLLDERSGAHLYFKCENLQRVGAFKVRGAMNAIAQIPAGDRSRGVVTHSSGNHAQAVALAAASFGIPATIVMPVGAPAVKRAATESYGARVVTCADTLADREAQAEKVIRETGAVLVHPYDDEAIIAGQGTAALELIEQVSRGEVIGGARQPERLDAIVTPVGGGGLLAGTALAADDGGPAIEVTGAEPTGADDAHRSLTSGTRVEAHEPRTIADGLLTTLGERNFNVLRERGVDVVLVDDEATVAAMRLVWERMKLVVEPSAAVPLAAVLAEPERWRGRHVGIVLSGGNVDTSVLFDALVSRLR